MTFKDIELKIFKSNIRRYRLYLISNIIIAAIFYVYASIFTNDEFMNPYLVDPLISSNIFAPSVSIAAFILFFIPYSYKTFNKFRKKDFGILLAIGMSEKDIRKAMIVENSIISLISLGLGLVLGTILSIVFYLFIIKVIGITVLSIQFNIKSYGVTILLFLAAYVITLICEFVSELRYSIIDFLKLNQRGDRGKEGNIVFLILGMGIIICAIMVMCIDYYDDRNNVLVSMGIFFIGLYIIAGNSMIFISLFKKIFRKRYYKNLISISNFKHDFNKTKKVLTVMIALICFSEVMIVVGITSSNIISRYARTYNPYDIVYASIFNKNELEQSKIDEIMSSGETKLKEEKELDFMRNGAFNIFPVDELNKEFDRDYKVEEGKFILIFPYDMHDGYGHENDVKVNIPQISIEGSNEDLTLNFQESNIDIITGTVYSFAMYKVIVNDKDYNRIKDEGKGYWKGTLHFFSFEDWTKTGSIVEKLKTELFERNGISDLKDARIYTVSSKFESYAKAKKADIFLMSVLTFMSILLILSADIMMHFKLIMDLENEKIYYSSLCKIGMSYEELERIVDKKLKLAFLIPAILSSIIALMYNNQISTLSDLIDKGFRFNFLISIIVILIQWIIYIFYKKYFTRLISF